MYGIMTLRQYFQLCYPDVINRELRKTKKTSKSLIGGWISSMEALKIEMRNKDLPHIDRYFLANKVSEIKNKSKREGLAVFLSACHVVRKTKITKEDIDEAIEYLKQIKGIA